MTKQKETFSGLMLSFQYHFDLRTVFDDLLTMCMCAVTPDIATGKSVYEKDYMAAIDKYKNSELRHNFPKLFAALVDEMTERMDSGAGNDVLGDFYEAFLTRRGRGQFFTPWPICRLMAQAAVHPAKESAEGKLLSILEPACGSGRMLLCAMREIGVAHRFYAVDIDPVCSKMTALNLFLHGMFGAEVMCGNALSPEQFTVSYRLSALPLGIYRIEDKE